MTLSKHLVLNPNIPVYSVVKLEFLLHPSSKMGYISNTLFNYQYQYGGSSGRFLAYTKLTNKGAYL